MPKRPRYTQEFKEQAIKLSLMPDTTLDQVAQELGISAGTLVGWRQKAGVSPSRSGVSAAMRLELESLRRRTQELEKEKKAVEMERDILKNRPRPYGPPQFTRNTLWRKMTMVQAVAVCFLEAYYPVKKPGPGDFGLNIGGAFSNPV